MATNLALCGTPALRFENHQLVSLAPTINRNQTLLSRPLRDIATSIDGSANAYCATMTERYVNNENSLMWLLRIGLLVNPSASLGWLGRWLYAVKLACIVLFAVGALTLRSNEFVTVGAVIVAIVILTQFAESYFYSVYSLLFPLLLANLGAWALLLWGRARSAAALACQTFLLGVLAAFTMQVRTSYAPILWMIALAGVVATLRFRPELMQTDVRRRFVPAVIAPYIIGSLIAGWLLVAPARANADASGLTHHIVSHPVVLGLAVPPNALANREGIRWDDAAGMALARRVNPDVVYLTSGYADALWTYYRNLWRQHPAEMAQIYWNKAAIAGVHALQNGVAGPHGWTLQAALLPLAWIPDGRLLIAVSLLAAIAGLRRAWRLRSGSALACGLMAAVLVMLALEAALIVPEFALKLHSPLIGTAAILGLSLTAVGASIAVRSPVRPLLLRAPVAPLLVFVAVTAAASVTTLMREVFGQEDLWAAAAIGLLAALIFVAFRRLADRRWATAVVALLMCALILRAGAVIAERIDRTRSPVPVGEQPPVGATVTDLLRERHLWTFTGRGSSFDPSGVLLVSGQPGLPYEYLIVSKPVTLTADSFVLAQGVLAAGGLTLGLQREQKWTSVVNVTTKGKFIASVRVPADGDFQIVLASALPEGQLTNDVRLTVVATAK